MAYRLDGELVRLRVGAYDRAQPLLIDPVVIAYSTYLGGGATDLGYQIAVDPIGQAYVTGLTASTNFNTAGEIEGDSFGTDAFIAKLNPAGNALAYATYLGGNGNDEGTAIAVDDQGFAYVTGTTTSTDFNTTANAFQPDRPGRDAWVAKLNPTGNTLAFSTYLGGGGDDRSGFQIAVDSTRSVYLTGVTSSTDFPTSDEPIQGNQPGDDAYVVKLNPLGTTLMYGTYLGGSGDDLANGIAIDPIGEAYVIGSTESTNFPVVGGVGGDQDFFDAFVTKLNPAGTAFAYSTYLGGDGIRLRQHDRRRSGRVRVRHRPHGLRELPDGQRVPAAVRRHDRRVRDQAEPGRGHARVLDLPRWPLLRSRQHDRDRLDRRRLRRRSRRRPRTSRSRCSTRPARAATTRSWSSSARPATGYRTRRVSAE